MEDLMPELLRNATSESLRKLVEKQKRAPYPQNVVITRVRAAMDRLSRLSSRVWVFFFP